MRGTVISLAITLIVMAPVYADDLVLTVQPACNGQGISGMLTDTSVPLSVHFVSCETSYGSMSVFQNDSLENMTKLAYKESTDEIAYWIDGIEIGEELGEIELDRMARVYTEPEGELVTPLYSLLLEEGYDPDWLPMTTIQANLVSYEAAFADHLIDPPCSPPPSCDCLGCCGPKCWGCTGCYTSECLLHDECVRLYGHKQCIYLLRSAIFSVVRHCP